MAASFGSITTWFATPGSNIAPCRIFTRSTDTPSVSSGLANASSCVSGKPPPAAGSPRLYWIADYIAVTGGSRASAAKKGGTIAPGTTSSCAAFAQFSSRG